MKNNNMKRLVAFIVFLTAIPLCKNAEASSGVLTINEKDTGYRGIWYMNQPSGDEYVYKYSGGLGTFCAKHKPFAVYCDKVKKTFFCYGGTTTDGNQRLLHIVSYYDHKTGSCSTKRPAMRTTTLLSPSMMKATSGYSPPLKAHRGRLMFTEAKGRTM
jgi:hypothetical protein